MEFDSIVQEDRPDDGIPPTFAAVSNEVPLGSVLDMMGDSNLVEKLQNATVTLWDRVNALFLIAPSVFISQYIYNKKFKDLDASESARRLAASASESVAVLTTDNSAKPKTTLNLVQTAVTKESRAIKRKFQSKQDKVLQRLQHLESAFEKECRKSRKAEGMVKKLTAELAAKDTRGQDEGASQINSAIKAPTASSTIPNISQETEVKAPAPTNSLKHTPSLGGKKLRNPQKKRRVRIQVDDANTELKNVEPNKQLRQQKQNWQGRGRGRGRGKRDGRGL